MKPIKILVFATIAMALAITACKKEPTLKEQMAQFEYEVTSKIPYDQIQVIEKGFKGANGSTQILVFQNMDAFKLTLAELDRQVNELDSVFVATFSHLSEELINAKETELGFDERKPLVDFATFFTYYSLYQQIEAAQEIWLNNEVLDDANEPDNHFIFEHSLRAILNTDCEVQIADTIYKLTADGYFKIPAGNFKSLSLLDRNPTNWQTIKDIVYIGNDGSTYKSSYCRTNKRNAGFRYNAANNRRIKWVVSHWTHPWSDRRVAAKIDNFKRHNNRWKKFRADSFVIVYGFVSDAPGDCSVQLNFNPSLIGRFEPNVKHLKQKIHVQTRTKSGWVQSSFEGAGGISHQRTLTW